MKTKDDLLTTLLIDQYIAAPWKLYGYAANEDDKEIEDIFCDDDSPQFNSPYSQIMIVCERDSHGLDFIRDTAIKHFSMTTPISYFLTKETVESFLRYYCVSQREMTKEQFKKENIETENFNKIYNYLDHLKSLPVSFILKPTSKTLAHFPEGRLTVIDDLTPFLDERSAEDLQTQKLTLLQKLRSIADKQHSTQLILWEVDGKDIEKEIRPEILKVPDLTLFLRKTPEKMVYTLTSCHDIRKREINLTIAYDSQYGQFVKFSIVKA